MRYLRKHQKVYFDNTGCVPVKNHCIHHLNGDHYDDDINNLIFINAYFHRDYHKQLLVAWQNISGIKTKSTCKYLNNSLKGIDKATQMILDAVEERELFINARRKAELEGKSIKQFILELIEVALNKED